MSEHSPIDVAAEEDPRRGAPPEIVGPYLARILGNDGWAECRVELVAGGKSNLTYVISSAAGEVVLRRPPLAAVLPTAHDMVREHRVLSALQGTDVPVPIVHHLCTDVSVVGAPFYVMEKVNGLIVRDTVPAGYADSPAERSRIADALVETLIAIHRVPITGALEGYGRTDGYLARQIRRWTAQWEATKAAVATEDAPLDDLDQLAADLSAQLPEQRETTLVHGDFRLDNTMLDPRDPGRILAVLDWELSTLGDPLADVGLIGVYWGDRNAPAGSHQLTARVTLEPGFPSRIEVFRRYAERSGRDISALPWYLAFGYFKLAVIATGIAARHQAGGMIGEGFDSAAGSVPGSVRNGLDMLAHGLADESADAQ
jgi:aminoglycoside phosphotransferase (APT) family kinase protein